MKKQQLQQARALKRPWLTELLFCFCFCCGCCYCFCCSHEDLQALQQEAGGSLGAALSLCSLLRGSWHLLLQQQQQQLLLLLLPLLLLGAPFRWGPSATRIEPFGCFPGAS